MRRVVTGHTKDGKSIITSDEKVASFSPNPSLKITSLWGEDKTVTFPTDGAPSKIPKPFPETGGFRYLKFTFEPQNPDAPDAGKGMHVTDTIDLIYIISGEIWMEIDDGVETLLKAGDSAIQNGTIHAWHNRGDVPCEMLIAIIGAERAG